MFELILKQIKTGYNLAVMNWNFTRIKEVLEQRVLHRKDGHNVMEQDLDMNGYSILNANIDYGPINSRLGSVEDKIEEVDNDLQATKGSVQGSLNTISTSLSDLRDKDLEQDGRLTALESSGGVPEATTSNHGTVQLATAGEVNSLALFNPDRAVTVGNLQDVRARSFPTEMRYVNEGKVTYEYLIEDTNAYQVIEIPPDADYITVDILAPDFVYFRTYLVEFFRQSPSKYTEILFSGDVIKDFPENSKEVSDENILFLSSLSYKRILAIWGEGFKQTPEE